MEKDLDYFLGLNYPIEVVKISDESGGGYCASIPMLGKNAFLGDGETIEKAIQNLEKVKILLFKRYLEKNIPIPEPSNLEAKQYSGRFVLRIPSELHRFLSLEAQKYKSTLNQYILFLLTRKACLQSIEFEIASIRKDISSIYEILHYQIETPSKDKKDEYCDDNLIPDRYMRAA